MSYVDEKVKEIIEANGNEIVIKNILRDIYISIQMNSEVRSDFENLFE